MIKKIKKLKTNKKLFLLRISNLKILRWKFKTKILMENYFIMNMSSLIFKMRH